MRLCELHIADFKDSPGDRVVSLEMSPQDDTFLSGATDDTVRLWDLRTQNAQVSLPQFASLWFSAELAALHLVGAP